MNNKRRFQPLFIDSAVLVAAKLLSLPICIAFFFFNPSLFESFARGSLLASTYAGLILMSVPYALQLAAQDRLPTAHVLALSSFSVITSGCVLTTMFLEEGAAVLAQLLIACYPSLILPLSYERLSRRAAVLCHALIMVSGQPMMLAAQVALGDVSVPDRFVLPSVVWIAFGSGLFLFFRNLHELRPVIVTNTLTMIIGQTIGALVFANAVFSDPTIESGVFWFINQCGMLLISFVAIMRFRLLKSLSHYDMNAVWLKRLVSAFYIGFAFYCASLLLVGAFVPALWAALYGCFLIGQAASKLAGLTLLAARDRYLLLTSGGVGSIGILCCWWSNEFSSAIDSSVSALICGAMCSSVFLCVVLSVPSLNQLGAHWLWRDAG